MRLNILFPKCTAPVQIEMEYMEWPYYCGGIICYHFQTLGAPKGASISTGKGLIKAFAGLGFASIVLADNMDGELGRVFYDMLPDVPVKIDGSTWVVHKDIVYNDNSGNNCFNVMICRSRKP